TRIVHRCGPSCWSWSSRRGSAGETRTALCLLFAGPEPGPHDRIRFCRRVRCGAYPATGIQAPYNPLAPSAGSNRGSDTMVDAGQMVKKIQEMRDEGYLSDAILRETVKQIKASSTDYNFVGVYLFNEADNELWLHNYMGESTEHAKIPVGKGVCGTAVA